MSIIYSIIFSLTNKTIQPAVNKQENVVEKTPAASNRKNEISAKPLPVEEKVSCM
jgi:hypothetical protein